MKVISSLQIFIIYFAVTVSLVLSGVIGDIIDITDKADHHVAGAVEPVPAVTISKAWVASGDAEPAAAFHPRSAILYFATISNQTSDTQKLQTNWTTEGPCGTILSETIELQTPPGSVDWLYQDTLMPDTCAGDYQFTVTVWFDGKASQSTISFRVVDIELFLPMMRR